MRNLAVVFSIGAGIGASGCYFYLSSLKPHENKHESIRMASDLGLPTTDKTLAFDGFIVSYDYRTRNAKWVLEKVTKDSLEGKASRNNSSFHEEESLDPLLRSTLHDFKDSGYDRGHLTPAADHKGSQKAMNETFSLANISPQVGAGFNRDYWERFERYVRSLAKKGEDVYVVTGPLYLPLPCESPQVSSSSDQPPSKWIMQHNLIGSPPALVSVPTHFYKVILSDGKGEGGQRRVGVGAFVIPNQAIQGRTPLSAFAVPLDSLEQVAGTRFFPKFLSESKERTRVINQGAVAWRSHAIGAMKPFDRIEMAREIVPLLAPPSSSSADSSSLLQSPTADPPSAPPPPPKAKVAAGVCHLCDIDGCKLPGPLSFSSDSNKASSPAERKPKKGGRRH